MRYSEQDIAQWLELRRRGHTIQEIVDECPPVTRETVRRHLVGVRKGVEKRAAGVVETELHRQAVALAMLAGDEAYDRFDGELALKTALALYKLIGSPDSLPTEQTNRSHLAELRAQLGVDKPETDSV